MILWWRTLYVKCFEFEFESKGDTWTHLSMDIILENCYYWKLKVSTLLVALLKLNLWFGEHIVTLALGWKKDTKKWPPQACLRRSIYQNYRSVQEICLIIIPWSLCIKVHHCMETTISRVVFLLDDTAYLLRNLRVSIISASSTLYEIFSKSYFFIEIFSSLFRMCMK